MATHRTLTGIAASGGIAIGQARVLVPPVIVIDRRITRQLVPAEVTRLRQAVTSTDAQLASLSARLEAEHLHEGHLILEAHRLMLRDDEVVEGARRLIESDEIAAECAVRHVIDGISAKFERMEDPYLRERGADVEAIGERLLRTLLGLPELLSGASAPGTIGIGSILSPIDALHLPRSGLQDVARSDHPEDAGDPLRRRCAGPGCGDPVWRRARRGWVARRDHRQAERGHDRDL